VVLSKLNQFADVQKATSLGAVEFLSKSDITLAELVEKIKRRLEK
jgi:hypothetical protein